MNISLSARSRLRIRSFETGSAAAPSRVSLLLISILRRNLVLTYEIPPEFRGGVHLYLNRHTLSGQSLVYRVTQLRADGRATACRWHSLPRVRRHRASKPHEFHVVTFKISQDQSRTPAETRASSTSEKIT